LDDFLQIFFRIENAKLERRRFLRIKLKLNY